MGATGILGFEDWDWAIGKLSTAGKLLDSPVATRRSVRTLSIGSPAAGTTICTASQRGLGFAVPGSGQLRSKLLCLSRRKLNKCLMH